MLQPYKNGKLCDIFDDVPFPYPGMSRQFIGFILTKRTKLVQVYFEQEEKGKCPAPQIHCRIS